MLRTHTCGELRKDMSDSKTVLCGWVDSRRDHGKLVFIDIRDRYGLTQVVFIKSVAPEAYELARTLKAEDSIQVTGQVVPRSAKTVNPGLPTGEVEVCAEKLVIFSKSQDLPFPMQDADSVGDDLRLTWRYLDLRRPRMQERILIRHRLAQAARAYFNNLDFVEVETPMLTRSTPEGARDFLVPSRLNPGTFYALPQSPQLFKQLLMVAGFDRYYQITKCFRDEDMRKDRQPEFTQIDLEMSFVDEEDIYTLIEGLIYNVFKQALGYELKLPFPRMTHREAMETYGTDKPNLPGDDPYRFLWVVDFPLFKYNEVEKRWDSEHHPFTAPKKGTTIEDMEKDPGSVISSSYDLVLNGNELGSGSIRIHDRSLQQKVFSLLNISEDEARQKFGFLLNAFEYGPPPHGGFAAGLDRLTAIVTKTESIRDVIAFPKTQKGTCLMTEAPSKVSPSQLEELGVRIIETDEQE
jgi:aspartyl-tRNA synthetase